MTVAALAPTYVADVDLDAGPPGPVVEEAAINPVEPSESLVYPVNTGGPASFFRNASDGVASGRIPSGSDQGGNPAWIRGLCWRPLRCLYPDRYPLDCSDCGGRAPDFAAGVYAQNQHVAAILSVAEGGDGLVHTWRSRLGHTAGATFNAAEAANWIDMGPDIYGMLNHPDNQKANAFEVVFRDKITNGTIPVTAEDMRVHMGLAFGGALSDQINLKIDDGSLAVPAPLVGNANDAAIVVAYLEHETGFAGEGTLVLPSVFLPYLLEKHAINDRNGRYRTAAGNRVISEGISIHTVPGGANGTANIALVGPVDYAQTPIVGDKEGTRDRGDFEAMKIEMKGLVRTDYCSAGRAAALIPAGVSISEV